MLGTRIVKYDGASLTPDQDARTCIPSMVYQDYRAI